MAGRGISIDILANVRDALKGTGDVEKALGDIESTLEDMSRDGDRSVDKMSRGFRDLARDADKSAEKMEREFKDSYKSIERASDRAADSADDDLGRVKDGAKEVQGEIGQNMGEAFSSFRGNLEDIGQIGQDTLGGLASTASQLGPAGIVAGAGLGAAAAAIGNITGAFEKAKEASDAAKESAYEYGLTVAESGKYADAASRINELTGSVESLKNIQDLATISGWEQADVLNALATGKGLPALTEAFNEGANATSIASARGLELQGVLDGTKQGFDLATDGARIQASALYDLASRVGVATGEFDDLGNKIVTMPDGKEIVIDAKTQRAYEDIDALEKKRIGNKSLTVDADTRPAFQKLDNLIYTINRRTAKIKIGGTGSARQILGG